MSPQGLITYSDSDSDRCEKDQQQSSCRVQSPLALKTKISSQLKPPVEDVDMRFYQLL